MVPFVLFIVTVLALATAAFALYNAEPVTVRFFTWKTEQVPLAGVILTAVALGALPVSLVGLIGRVRLRHRIRQLEARVQELEEANTKGDGRKR
ncbi:MAG TPA: LapA family protein [Methylomirabilota bacterium]|nr:LapA family protein [Methylomirabilota bacterium]